MNRTTSQTRKTRYSARHRRKGRRMADTQDNGLLKPYQIITDRIIEMLEAGQAPWRKPWQDAGAPKNFHSGKEYRGVNVFMLAMTGAMMGYPSPYWVTFRQALERGGNVRKGEKGTPVVFWKILERDRDGADESDDEPDGKRRIPMLRQYFVFNVAQCDGLAPVVQVTEKPFCPIEVCEHIVQTMPRPPTIEHRETRAFYAPGRDIVNMPRPELFTSGEEYYATLFHELVHATGHPTRLDRDTIKEAAPFGSATYAKEELVAEMGATFLCSRAGIEQVTIENSAAYLRGWLAKLRKDPKLIVLAASAAQKACDYILAVNPRENLNTATTAAIASEALMRQR